MIFQEELESVSISSISQPTTLHTSSGGFRPKLLQSRDYNSNEMEIDFKPRFTDYHIVNGTIIGRIMISENKN